MIFLHVIIESLAYLEHVFIAIHHVVTTSFTSVFRLNLLAGLDILGQIYSIVISLRGT